MARFTVALFTVAKIWDQPKHLLMGEQIKMVCIDTVEHYSTLERKISCHCNHIEELRGHYDK